MTLLSPFGIRLDSLPLNTYAHMLDRVDGIDVLAAKRANVQETAFVPGSVEVADLWARQVTRSYHVIVGGTDANGTVTDPAGEAGHLRTNIDALMKILGKKGAPIAYEQDIPDGAGGTIILTGDCYAIRAIPVKGSRGLRRFLIDLVFPYPYLHAGSQIVSAGNAAAFTISTVLSTEPISDMVLTFKVGTNQRLTVTSGVWAGQYVELTGTPPAAGIEVDVGARTVTNLTTGLDADGLIAVSSAAWMEWPPGDAALGLTLTGGGTVDLAYYHAHH